MYEHSIKKNSQNFCNAICGSKNQVVEKIRKTWITCSGASLLGFFLRDFDATDLNEIFGDSPWTYTRINKKILKPIVYVIW